ncbi:MAG: hypothetical protein MUO26_03010 [Methanotrichaceae archaeon]|nr:hypothetical protein [Methanotrichaceae archaeon]
MKYAKIAMALIAACLLVVPALSIVPDDQNPMRGQAGQDCQPQICDRHIPEMGFDDKPMIPCQKPEMGPDDKPMIQVDSETQ